MRVLQVIARLNVGGTARYLEQLVTGLSPRGVELLARGIGRREQYVSIAPGVEPLELVDRLEARAAMGLPADALVVAWLARVTAVRAPHRLLELALEFPDVTFLLGGALSAN